MQSEEYYSRLIQYAVSHETRDCTAEAILRAELRAPRLPLGWADLVSCARETIRDRRAKRAALARPVVDRRTADLRRDLLSAWESCSYRAPSGKWAGGNTTVSIRTGAPGAIGQAARVRSSNGKWSGNDLHVTLTVPAHWRVSVQARGLSVVGGRLCLRAEETAPGRYQCTVVAQGRGLSLYTETVYARTHSQWGTRFAAVGVGRSPRAAHRSLCDQLSTEHEYTTVDELRSAVASYLAPEYALRWESLLTDDTVCAIVRDLLPMRLIAIVAHFVAIREIRDRGYDC